MVVAGTIETGTRSQPANSVDTLLFDAVSMRARTDRQQLPRISRSERPGENVAPPPLNVAGSGTGTRLPSIVCASVLLIGAFVAPPATTTPADARRRRAAPR